MTDLNQIKSRNYLSKPEKAGITDLNKKKTDITGLKREKSKNYRRKPEKSRNF